jgi:hypothetical protein
MPLVVDLNTHDTDPADYVAGPLKPYTSSVMVLPQTPR